MPMVIVVLTGLLLLALKKNKELSEETKGLIWGIRHS